MTKCPIWKHNYKFEKRFGLDLKKKKTVFIWFFCVSWFFLLIYLSSEDGTSTAERSHFIAKFIGDLFGLSKSKYSEIHEILRISAHFIIFFVMGILLCLAIYATWRKWKTAIFSTLGFCFALSIFDEAKKIFIPGRHLSWSEAGLNALGALFGVAIVLCLNQIYLKVKKKRLTP